MGRQSEGGQHQKCGHRGARDSRRVTAPGLKGPEEETEAEPCELEPWRPARSVGTAGGLGLSHCHPRMLRGEGVGREWGGRPRPVPSCPLMSGCCRLTEPGSEPASERARMLLVDNVTGLQLRVHACLRRWLYVGIKSLQMYSVKDLEMKSSWVEGGPQSSDR